MSVPPGFIDLFDSTGLSVGAVPPSLPPPPPVGFLGLLDFTGIPVGQKVAPAKKGRGFKGAGKHRYYVRALIERMLEEEVSRILKRKLTDDAVTESTMRLKQKAFERKVEEITARRTRIIAATAVILAEV